MWNGPVKSAVRSLRNSFLGAFEQEQGRLLRPERLSWTALGLVEAPALGALT